MMYNNYRKQALADRGLLLRKPLLLGWMRVLGDGNALFVILRPSPLLC